MRYNYCGITFTESSLGSTEQNLNIGLFCSNNILDLRNLVEGGLGYREHL
jgi:hypothetical protein